MTDSEKYLTLEQIESVIVKEVAENMPGTTITVVTLHLRNGAKAVGINYGAIDPNRQDWNVGRNEARKQALDKVWELEGYLLRERLAAAEPVEASGPFGGPALLEQARALCHAIERLPAGHHQSMLIGKVADAAFALQQLQTTGEHFWPVPIAEEKATGDKLTEIVRGFIEKHHVSCPETISQSDHVIEDAYELIEQLADVVGYYRYPDE